MITPPDSESGSRKPAIEVSTTGTPPVLALDSITKRFGTVEALKEASFAVEAGSIHALLGENGAGKTTLMQIAFGLTQADSGTIRAAGRAVRINSPRDAKALGIGMVQQHFALVPTMTVAENLRLAAGPRREISPGIELDGGAIAGHLSVAMRQRLEIAKAMASNARILLLDEPTAVLAPQEIDALMATIRKFADGGGSVVLITHKLREVLAVADMVTVLRAGRVVFHGPVAGLVETSLARAMLGDDVGGVENRPVITYPSDRVSPGSSSTGEPLVAATCLGLKIPRGEITGIAAVEGNGHREILRALGGVARVDGITINGVGALVPEDRISEGLIGDLSVTENIALGLGRKMPGVRRYLIDWAAAGNYAGKMLRDYRIVASGPTAATGSLSGGNQQKLIIARALALKPDLLVLENPTRGLDFRASQEVYARLRETAAAGCAVVVWSSDLDEVIELADRILVVYRGEMRAVPPGASRSRVGEMMLGLTQ